MRRERDTANENENENVANAVEDDGATVDKSNSASDSSRMSSACHPH